MNSKSDKFKLSPKEYLFLAVCLFIFYVTGLYLMWHGTIPEGINLIFTGIGVVVAIPIGIFILKNV